MRAAKMLPHSRNQTSVTVSPKFQVVIPKDLRERMGLRPGMMVDVHRLGDNIIEIVPLSPRREGLGFGGAFANRGGVARRGSGRKPGKKV
jgi:AbrB family looped-hinge helix DNA binding protein